MTKLMDQNIDSQLLDNINSQLILFSNFPIYPPLLTQLCGVSSIRKVKSWGFASCFAPPPRPHSQVTQAAQSNTSLPTYTT